jgi:hypothetical protein
MATYYFRNVGVNWGDAANWSLSSGGPADGAVPTNLDDVKFDNNSGNCTVNSVGRVCKSIDFTNYINTITFTLQLRVSGDVTLFPGAKYDGGNQLVIDADANLTNNFTKFPIRLSPTGNITITLMDDWYQSGIFTANLSSTTTVINGNKLYLTSGSAIIGTSNASAIEGTTVIEIIGECRITPVTSNTIRNTLIINSGLEVVTYDSRNATNNIRWSNTIIYKSGSLNMINTPLFLAQANTTFIDMHKCPGFTSLGIFLNSAVTFNELPSGTPKTKFRLYRFGAAGTITINFTDEFRKFAKFIEIENVAFGRKGQVLVLTDSKRAFSNATNASPGEVIYINNLPNGVMLENSSMSGYVPRNPTTYVEDPSCVPF